MNAALDLLDRRDRLEKAVLTVLLKHPNGYYNAFQNISRGTRLIYVHAYQSYVWNRAVSQRKLQFGLTQVLIGDLAVRQESAYLLE
jgi:tRNA pseudouridine13 synthase